MTLDEAAHAWVRERKITHGSLPERWPEDMAASFAAGAAWAFAECERIVSEYHLHEVGRDILAAIRRAAGRGTP